jgi:hypothetical protein
MKNSTGAKMSEEVGMESGLEEAYIERVVELEKALADAESKNDNLESRLVKAYEMPKAKDEDEEEMDEEDEENEEDMAKSLLKSVPEPVRQMLQKAQFDADFAREELRKERESKRDREYVAKARQWDNLTLDPEEVGPALRRLADAEPVLSDAIEKALDAVNAQAESASIFEELGRGTSSQSDSDAFSKVQSLAKSAYERGDFATIEQAISATVATNPDLYTAYRAETR